MTRIPPPVLIAFVVLLLYPAAQIATLLFYKKRLYATACDGIACIIGKVETGQMRIAAFTVVSAVTIFILARSESLHASVRLLVDWIAFAK